MLDGVLVVVRSLVVTMVVVLLLRRLPCCWRCSFVRPVVVCCSLVVDLAPERCCGCRLPGWKVVLLVVVVVVVDRDGGGGSWCWRT